MNRNNNEGDNGEGTRMVVYCTEIRNLKPSLPAKALNITKNYTLY